MPEYEIPLSPVYDQGHGPRVQIKDGIGSNVTLLDDNGPAPEGQNDVIGLSDGEAEELCHILIAYLNRANDGTLGSGASSGQFEEHRTDN